MLTNPKPATRVITLEEAFLHPKMWEFYSPADQRKFAPVKDILSDVGEARIRRMDAAGIDLQVLSHVQPGVQTLKDTDQSIRLSKEVNDWLSQVVKDYPLRFAGFAMLPTQSPEDAADELERAVRELGLKGALINGHTNGKYLDDEAFSVLFQRAELLDVPIYIHPTDPPETVSNVYYHNDAAMITGWGWPVETGTHLLRIMASGLFDRYPNLKIIVGHMGELLPYCMTRLNVAMTMGEDLLAVQDKKVAGVRPYQKMEKSVSYYMRNNIFVTTSGVFDQPVFECALAVLGLDNLLFSVDDPLQDNFEGIEFLRATRLSSTEKEQFAHGNAERLLKLPWSDGSRAGYSPSKPQTVRSSILAFRARTQSRMRRALIRLLVK